MTTDSVRQRSISEVIESAGITRRHWLYFTLIFLLLLADGMDSTIVSHIFPSLIKEWGVSVGGGIALIVSGGFVAMGLGSLVAGRLADQLGRKPVLVAAGFILSAMTILGGTAENFTMFTIWRFIACVGIGAVLPTAVTLLADLVPQKRRGAMVAASYAGLGLGTTVGATLAGAILPAEGWRVLMFVGGAIPLIITVLIWIGIPESPTLLAARGSTNRARRSLVQIFPRVNPDEVDLTASVVKKQQSATFQRLLSQPYTWTSVLLWVFGFLSLGTQLLIIQYLPTLLQMPSPGLTTVESSTIVAVYGFASVASLLLLGAVLAKWQRFGVIAACLAVSAIVAVAVSLVSDAGFVTLLIVLGVTGFFVPAALGPTRNVLAVEAYPTDMRATGVGITELSARLGSAGQGALGGVLIGGGLGLGGFFLALLVPLGILGAALAGLKALHRPQETSDPEQEPIAVPESLLPQT
ncbi:4-hydroxybenzoate transporter PcaK (plasmid) [Corynebacterium occultum]|uniref:4-hydroxybenzoate transporter PcaK n=1 Tax=Corynebacterium occultum TaxID=2675219 RepID=A0A6B8W807_9CORY|nr:MFS transporter [Corynebacterium occultum]QGU08771.1 4-hydroxybenzoate transporter PcaK [Corynebacterium occultum]